VVVAIGSMSFGVVVAPVDVTIVPGGNGEVATVSIGSVGIGAVTIGVVGTGEDGPGIAGIGEVDITESMTIGVVGVSAVIGVVDAR